MKKSVVPRTQVNVRLQSHHIRVMNRACVVLNMTQAEVVEKALEILASRKRITLEEGQAS